LTFGLGIIILQGVSRRKSLAGVNIMMAQKCQGLQYYLQGILFDGQDCQIKPTGCPPGGTGGATYFKI
jgi:hypothetical protein